VKISHVAGGKGSEDDTEIVRPRALLRQFPAEKPREIAQPCETKNPGWRSASLAERTLVPVP